VIIRIDRTGQLSDEQRSGVLGLTGAAGREDAVPALSEQVLLDVRNATAPTRAGTHLLAYAGTNLAGYAHLGHDTGEPGDTAGAASTAELVVEPAHRRQGVGAALIGALEGATARDAPNPKGRTLQIWSHGDLQGARALASHRGYAMVRELWQMHRSLRPDSSPLPEVILPAGFSTRHLVVGRDEQAWLRVNAAAFVNHPEQGRMTRRDLDQRIAEPWFDETGLILIEDTRGPAPRLAASHWTKVVPVEGQGVSPAPTEGEVYVVGVDPAYQGLGLGRTVTVLGLAHLRDRGLTDAMLYVDADNKAAVATYSRLDFTRRGVDIMYARTVHPPV
jgi:mycothiol synthase